MEPKSFWRIEYNQGSKNYPIWEVPTEKKGNALLGALGLKITLDVAPEILVDYF